MSVTTSIPFLRRSDKWKSKEPYRVDAAAGLKTDVISDIAVEDVRGHEADLTFERAGIEVLKLSTKLALHDFYDQTKVEEIYCVEIADAILGRLGGSTIQVFEAQVRRRAPGFPGSVIGIGGLQPALRPHIDISPEHALVKIASLNPNNAAQLQQRKWICVNAWRPLHGPLRDWPLALCDPGSLDLSADTIRTSNVTNGQPGENVAIHYDPRQTWMYLSDQLDDEVWVFRQASSDAEPGIAHCSFQLPPDHTQDKQYRESVEVRAFVYF